MFICLYTFHIFWKYIWIFMESCVSRGSPTFLYFNFLLSVTRRWVIQMSKLQMTVKCVC